MKHWLPIWAFLSNPAPPLKYASQMAELLQISITKFHLNLPSLASYVAPIGMHSVILGMPWLESIHPVIDWHRKTILSYFVYNRSAFSQCVCFFYLI